MLACSVAPCDSSWALALSSVLAEETEAVARLISVITSTSLSIRALTCAESSPNSSLDVSDDRTSRWPCSRWRVTSETSRRGLTARPESQSPTSTVATRHAASTA